MSIPNPQVGPPGESPRRPLPPGTQLDHYVIQAVLGSGGFGITYLANHTLLGRRYAIKEYFPDEFSYRDGQSVRSSAHSEPTYRWGLDRFLSEARALARFKHPSIVDVISVFEANGTAYLVLAYEQGRDFGNWAKDLGRPPNQAELDHIVPPLLDALEAIHNHGLLHRDVAPDNIMIRRDGTPVVIDFGSAREAVRGRSKVISAIVKRGFSPPEQYTSRPELQGPWSDIYALAATLYRAITGKMPTDSTDRLLDDNLEPLVRRAAGGGFRSEFLAALDHGLKLHGKDRPQTIAAWRAELFPGLQASSARASDAPASLNAQFERSGAPRSGAPVSGAPPRSRRSGRVSKAIKSERPDISWLDQVEAPPEPPKPTTALDDPTVRTILYGSAGLVIGAITGALSSIILVSIVSTSCSGDSCFTAYLPHCTLLGAIAGAVLGARVAKARPPGQPIAREDV